MYNVYNFFHFVDSQAVYNVHKIFHTVISQAMYNVHVYNFCSVDNQEK